MQKSLSQLASGVVAFTQLVSLGFATIGVRATLSSLLEQLLRSPLRTAEAV